MFILTTLSDTIPIVPLDFEKRTRQAIEDNVNEKYANKVIQKIGLCICFYDLLKASDGHIGATAGDGTVYVNIKFRLLVFRPHYHEILEGHIASSTPAGIRISLDIFDDIFVPPNQLLPNTVWNEKEKVWFWNGRTEPQESGSEGANGGEADAGEFFFDKHERVRFRVEGEEWKDQAPGEAQMARKMEMGAVAAAKGKQRADGVGAGMGAVEREKVKEGRCPWRITASMSVSGLGCTEWW